MAYIGNSPANTGNYQLVDDIASSFNGTLTSFALASGGIAITPAKSGQILANINGVMQEPDDGGTNGFKVTSSNIVFSSAPASGDTFWAVYQGQNVDIGTPSDDVVDTVHIKDDAVTAAKLANSINTEITANTAKVTNAITTHTGDVTGATALTIAAGAVDLAMLSATGTAGSGNFLRGDNAWAAVDGLPSQTGNAGKYLTTDASDASWATLDTDANSTTKGLYEMANVISANYVIGTNNNAISAGPITINSSISVTIPSGSTWVIA